MCNCGIEAGPLDFNLGTINLSTGSIQMSDYPKRRVVFKGPLAEVSLVGEVTKIKYGRHKDGDILWVHTLDAQASPESFAAPPAEETVEDLPVTPEDVRRVLVPPVPDAFVEEDVEQVTGVEVEGRPKKQTVARKKKASYADKA